MKCYNVRSPKIALMSMVWNAVVHPLLDVGNEKALNVKDHRALR